MRLDFNVLWIDDQQSSIDRYVYRMEPFFGDEGFRLKVTSASSLREAQNYIGDSVFIDDIDLVLVDYNLGGGEMGDIAVREIRSRVPYKDIIFYSAIPTTDLSQMILAQKVEGVFCAHREELTDRVLGVFRSLIKKVLDIDHCRGIVMGVTSDIDYLVNECLLALELVLDPSHKSTASSYTLKNLDDRLKRYQKVRDQLVNGMTMGDMLKSTEAVPATDRLKLLKKVLSLHFPDTHSEIRTTIDNYIVDVPRRRNKLGHMRLTAVGGIRTLIGTDVETVTADELKQLRQSLIAYQDKFEELASILGSASVNADVVVDSTDTSSA